MSWQHHAVAASFLFALGACVGSFLNVCVYRLPRGLNLLRPGSRCPGCTRPIAARDNLPVVGWLLLRGRCRACGVSIPIRYPTVEAAVGLLFAAAYAADLAATGGDPLEGGLLLPVGLWLLVVLPSCWALAAALILRDAGRLAGRAAVPVPVKVPAPTRRRG